MFRSALWGSVVLAASVAAAEPLQFQPRDTFFRLDAGRQQSGAELQLEAPLGNFANEDIWNYGQNSRVLQMGRPVGLLRILTNAGHVPCTAFVISDRHILTNHHCVTGLIGRENEGNVEVTRLESGLLFMGYQRDGVIEGVREYPVNVRPLEQDKEPDFAVLEVDDNPAADFGHLDLAAVDPIPDREILWIIGHPWGEHQKISREGCRTDAPAVSGTRLRHVCDTLPGNSGSPVIDPFRGAAVGLHFAGSRSEGVNFAIPIAEIAKRSEIVARLVQAAAPAPAPDPGPAPAPDLAPTAEDSPPVLTVMADGRGDYRDIAAAIAAAPDGARIEIHPGRYVGGAVVDRPLELVGIGARSTILWESQNADLLIWRATSGRIANLTMRQFGSSDEAVWEAIDFNGGAAVLESSDLRAEDSAAIHVRNAASPIIRNNLIHDSAQGGILVYQDAGGEIIANTIRDNQLSGIQIRTGGDPLVRDNEIMNHPEASIFVFDGGKGQIIGNTLGDNGISGIEIASGGDPVVRDNQILNNTFSGIVVTDSGRGQIIGNMIRGSGLHGIAIGTRGDPVVTDNVIAGNGGWGIWRADDGLGQISDNSFSGNTSGPTNF